MVMRDRRLTPRHLATMRAYRVTEPSRSRDEDPAVAELRRRARDLALRGKYKKAAATYEQLLEKTCGDAPSVLRLAELRRRIGDHAGARSAYELAISMYLDSGWDAKAFAVENALERLEVAPQQVSRLRALLRWSAACAVLGASACTRAALAGWRRIKRAIGPRALRAAVERFMVRLTFGRPRPSLASTETVHCTPRIGTDESRTA